MDSHAFAPSPASRKRTALAGVWDGLALILVLSLALAGCGGSSSSTGSSPASAVGSGSAPDGGAAGDNAGELDPLGDDDDDDEEGRGGEGNAQAAALTISSARWDSQDSALRVRGNAASRVTVAVLDAGSGALLGSATPRSSDGQLRWGLRLTSPASVPCQVRAEAGGVSVQAPVEGAPSSCGAVTPPVGGGGGSSSGGGSGAQVVSHVGRYTTYEGSKTCRECHQAETQHAHAATHYQWQGPTPYVVNMTVGGKLGGINDFCGFPDINWLGILTNLDGVQVDGGCATCHVGMGSKPESPLPGGASQAQLENVDCLICHSDTYKRKVVRATDGSFRFEPAPEKMTVPVLQAITEIQARPTRGSCVNCHSYAGGGCNNKRGDMEEAHREPPSASFDVHMASRALGGAGLICVDCHITRDHRIAGRGVDLRQTDLDVPVRCQNCHNTQPHSNADLNRHTARVDCSVCHIPFFAKITTTDMIRDYSKPPEILQEKRLYEPHITRAGNVIPEYRFWNGFSTFYKFGDPVPPVAERGPSGRVLMAGPVGSRLDPNAKLFAFKYHQAVLPFDPVSQRILPVKAGILFSTGNMDAAIKQGAADVGWPLPQGYGFEPAERYMGIYHEVAPASQALTCNACHNGGTRVNFANLGYTPKATRNNRPLCSSCHGSESASFSEIHQEHRNEGIACSECHTF